MYEGSPRMLFGLAEPFDGNGSISASIIYYIVVVWFL